LRVGIAHRHHLPSLRQAKVPAHENGQNSATGYQKLKALLRDVHKYLYDQLLESQISAEFHQRGVLLAPNHAAQKLQDLQSILHHG
jgi:hypothetical protein